MDIHEGLRRRNVPPKHVLDTQEPEVKKSLANHGLMEMGRIVKLGIAGVVGGLVISNTMMSNLSVAEHAIFTGLAGTFLPLTYICTSFCTTCVVAQAKLFGCCPGVDRNSIHKLFAIACAAYLALDLVGRSFGAYQDVVRRISFFAIAAGTYLAINYSIEYVSRLFQRTRQRSTTNELEV